MGSWSGAGSRCSISAMLRTMRNMMNLLPQGVALMALLASSGCKKNRVELENLVPSGATALFSVDARAITASDVYRDIMALAEEETFPNGSMEPLEVLKHECKVDIEAVETCVVAVDVVAQNIMGAVRLQGIGKKKTLACIGAHLVDTAEVEWVIGEADGKPEVTIEGGEMMAWAMDADTLVVSSQGWANAVKQRMTGEGRAAVDGTLAHAIALTDRKAHVWFAAEIPSFAQPFLRSTPLDGVLRVAGSANVRKDIIVDLAVQAGDADRAASLKTRAEELLLDDPTTESEAFVRNLTISNEDAVVRASATVPLGSLLDEATKAADAYIGDHEASE
jgi:hypothetical protein